MGEIDFIGITYLVDHYSSVGDNIGSDASLRDDALNDCLRPKGWAEMIYRSVKLDGG